MCLNIKKEHKTRVDTGFGLRFWRTICLDINRCA